VIRLFEKGDWVAWWVQDEHGPQYGVAVVRYNQHPDDDRVSLIEQDNGVTHAKPAHTLRLLRCYWSETFKPVKGGDLKPPHYSPKTKTRYSK
jgi:hypothetical protein